jgi:hypothetical protein
MSPYGPRAELTRAHPRLSITALGSRIIAWKDRTTPDNFAVNAEEPEYYRRSAGWVVGGARGREPHFWKAHTRMLAQIRVAHQGPLGHTQGQEPSGGLTSKGVAYVQHATLACMHGGALMRGAKSVGCQDAKLRPVP